MLLNKRKQEPLSYKNKQRINFNSFQKLNQNIKLKGDVKLPNYQSDIYYIQLILPYIYFLCRQFQAINDLIKVQYLMKKPSRLYIYHSSLQYLFNFPMIQCFQIAETMNRRSYSLTAYIDKQSSLKSKNKRIKNLALDDERFHERNKKIFTQISPESQSKVPRRPQINQQLNKMIISRKILSGRRKQRKMENQYGFMNLLWNPMNFCDKY